MASALAVGGGASVVAAAAAPPNSNPNGLFREVFGFADVANLSAPTGASSWNLGLLSTVALFGVHVNPDGALATNDSGWQGWNSQDAANFITSAHGRGVRVLLTVVNLEPSGFNDFCSALASRATTVSQAVSQIQQKGVDGVNVDYEATNGTCPNGQTVRSMLTDLISQFRSALPTGYVSIDTYGSAAGDTLGMFDVPALAGSADALFVMAYDMDGSNWSHPPLNCPKYCLSPNSPISGYYWNDSREMSEYTSAVASSKVILGVPYYGQGACVAGPDPNQIPVSNYFVPRYIDAEGISTDTRTTAWSTYRDPIDQAGQDPYADYHWHDSATGLDCSRQMYWDDVTSLGLKYDLVTKYNLRGIGIWTLNYGGGSQELWDLLAWHFTCTPPPNLQATNGYNILTSNGALYSFGDARYWGNLLDHHYPGPAVGLAETPTGCGYQILTSFGGIYSFGNAAYFGNLIDHHYPGPAVAMAMTPSGNGYAILTGFGGIYTFGDAQYFGNLIDHHYPGPAVSLSMSPSGRGYAILTKFGGIYTFGDAQYYGNLIDHHYPGPATSFAYTGSGRGYEILTGFGGIYTFGDARYYGNLLDHGYPGPGVAVSNTP